MSRSITQVGRNEEFYLQVAKGEIPGHSIVRRRGVNVGVGTTEVSLWGQDALYGFRTSAIAMKLSSSDANDALAGPGTGAHTVTLYGLDGDYAEINESENLAGQTAATTTATFLRIDRIEVDAAGSGGVNAGVIYAGTGTVTAGVPAVRDGRIEIGENVSEGAFYTVPADKTAYLIAIDIGGQHGTTTTLTTGPPVLCKIYTGTDGGLVSLKYGFHVTGGYYQNLEYPIQFVEKTDIDFRVTGIDVADMDVRGGFDLLVIDDDAA